MTVEEFERAELKEEKHISKVLKHKTFRKYGTAQVNIQTFTLGNYIYVT